MTFMTRGSRPTRRRARNLAGGVVAAGLLAAGGGATGAMPRAELYEIARSVVGVPGPTSPSAETAER
jgi:hypothetical protein